MRPSDEGFSENMIINEGSPEAMEEDRQNLIDQGWYTKNEIHVDHVGWSLRGNPIKSQLRVMRSAISSAYCNIPLKIMAKRAREPDVGLKIDSKFEDRADIILGSEGDLIELEVIIEKYITNNKNSSKPEDWKPEDWGDSVDTGKKAKISRDFFKKIRHKHFHFSASKTTVGYKANFEEARDKEDKKKTVRKRYYYEG